MRLATRSPARENVERDTAAPSVPLSSSVTRGRSWPRMNTSFAQQVRRSRRDRRLHDGSSAASWLLHTEQPGGRAHDMYTSCGHARCALCNALERRQARLSTRRHDTPRSSLREGPCSRLRTSMWRTVGSRLLASSTSRGAPGVRPVAHAAGRSTMADARSPSVDVRRSRQRC